MNAKGMSSRHIFYSFDMHNLCSETCHSIPKLGFPNPDKDLCLQTKMFSII